MAETSSVFSWLVCISLAKVWGTPTIPPATHSGGEEPAWKPQKFPLCLSSRIWSTLSSFPKNSSFLSPCPRAGTSPAGTQGGMEEGIRGSFCDPSLSTSLLAVLSALGLSRWVQFSLVTQSCPTLCDPMNCSTSGLPIYHQLPEFTQTHVHWVGDAIQPSHPLSSPSPPALNLSQNQGLFQWVSSSHQAAKVLEFQLQHQSFQWTPRTDLL